LVFCRTSCGRIFSFSSSIEFLQPLYIRYFLFLASTKTLSSLLTFFLFLRWVHARLLWNFSRAFRNVVSSQALLLKYCQFMIKFISFWKFLLWWFAECYQRVYIIITLDFFRNYPFYWIFSITFRRYYYYNVDCAHLIFTKRFLSSWKFCGAYVVRNSFLVHQKNLYLKSLDFYCWNYFFPGS